MTSQAWREALSFTKDIMRRLDMEPDAEQHFINVVTRSMEEGKDYPAQLNEPPAVALQIESLMIFGMRIMPVSATNKHIRLSSCGFNSREPDKVKWDVAVDQLVPRGYKLAEFDRQLIAEIQVQRLRENVVAWAGVW